MCTAPVCAQAVEDLFDEFDTDRSGAIDVPELLSLMAYDEPELCVLHAYAYPLPCLCNASMRAYVDTHSPLSLSFHRSRAIAAQVRSRILSGGVSSDSPGDPPAAGGVKDKAGHGDPKGKEGKEGKKKKKGKAVDKATASKNLAAFKNAVIAQLFRTSSSHLQVPDMQACLAKIGVHLTTEASDKPHAVSTVSPMAWLGPSSLLTTSVIFADCGVAVPGNEVPAELH